MVLIFQVIEVDYFEQDYFYENFCQCQFKISVFIRPFRLDRHNSRGDIMLFVLEDIPTKLIFSKISPIEGYYVEIDLRKQKWLIWCSYNPNKHNISKHWGAE